MANHFGYTSATAIFLALTAPVAQADITADDVWADWRNYMASSGYEISASEQRSGNRLSIGDMTMVLPVPEENSTVSLNLGSVSMIENGNGSVNIEFPNPMPIRFSVTEGGQEQVRGTVMMTHSGSVMLVEGSPNDVTYTHSSAMTEISMGEMVVEGEAVPPGIIDMSIKVANTSGVTRMKIGELREFDQKFNVGSVDYDIRFADPESDDRGSAKGAIQGLSFAGVGAMPQDMDPTNMPAMMAAGLSMDGGFTYRSGSSNIEGVGDGDQFAMTTSSSGGAFGVGLNDTNLRYSVESKDLDLSVSTSELPFPVSAKMGQTGFNLDMPIAKSDTASDFALAVTLGDFSMSDMIWGLFDPSGVLPRDPATVVMDLSGKAKMLFDLMDPDSIAAVENSATPPAELESLSINNLLVSLVGASLTGNGAFTFDNSDLQTFGGVPRPMGSLNLKLVGGNGLIDKLVQMGFVGDQDAMGARMMMGMLAVPGEAPDTLNSKIEINAEGHVLANGQRIQ